MKEIYQDVDVTAPAPETEPMRQHYFIAKNAQMIRRESELAGHTLTACVKTFGCQMNERDSEKLRGILEAMGCILTVDEEADLVIYNTCTVRENANLKVYGRLGYLNGLKKKNPRMKIILCGCMMQEKDTVEKSRKSYPFVDLVFGTHNIWKFAELINDMYESGSMIIDIWKDTSDSVEQLPTQRTYPFKSGVNIMYGCDNFCTYCIVPYVRGRERSREASDILREVERLADEGVVEVMLLGQNVNSYGKNLPDAVSFAELLRQVEKVDGIKRIRFMTSHPKDLSDELIEVMASSEKICPHLHLPLQSGSSRLLKKMNRHYTRESYLKLCERLYDSVPDLSLTTDLIVGFPGETEEDLEDTLDVVRRVGFDSAFTFIYSKRTGTPAASMPDQIPEDVVKDRFDRLLKLVQETGAARSERWQGRTMEVLAERVNDHDSSLITGRTAQNMIVHFPADPSVIGKILPVRMEECKGFYYFGSAVEE